MTLICRYYYNKFQSIKKFRNFTLNKAGSISIPFIFLTIVFIMCILTLDIWFFNFISSACVTMVTENLHANTKHVENFFQWPFSGYFCKAFYFTKRFHFLKNRSFKYKNFCLVKS